MFDVYPAKSVVAAIDGSAAAVDAAVWVAQEAVGREIPFRILYVIGDADYSRQTREAALAAAKAAHAAVEAACGLVKVESDIVHGDVTTMLIELSRSASLLSIGSPRDPADAARAETIAAKVVTSAKCSVAVIREGSTPVQDVGKMIVALLDDSYDDCDVLQQAMDEARLRHASLLAVHTCAAEPVAVGGELTCQLPGWTRHYPDVPAAQATVHEGFADFILSNAAAIGLVVIAADRLDDVAQLVGPTSPKPLRDSGVSVLVVNRQHL